MPITQQDIADKVGVSRRLVSYALNGGSRINPDTQNRILALASEMGYQPNRAAQTLVTGRTNQIALCVPTLSNPFHAEFIRHFEAFSRDTSYDLLITTTLDKKSALSKLAIDGMLLHHSIALPQEISCPVVLIQSPPSYVTIKSKNVFDQVLLDLSEASLAAMRHLLKQKPARIAFVSFSGMLDPEEPRHKAYLQMVQEAKLMPEIITLNYEGSEELRPLAHATLVRHFQTHGFPDALFCCNDEVALGAYRALRELGRKFPEETAVVGCDDIPETQDVTPTLSTIRHAWDDVCRCAWGLLLDRIENPDAPAQEKSFPGELVIRNSSLP